MKAIVRATSWACASIAFMAACGATDQEVTVPISDADGGGVRNDASADGNPIDGAGTLVDTGAAPEASSPVDGGDAPFDCTAAPVPGPDPTYELGGPLAAPQGGTLLPGVYRAVKGTHAYRESVAGDCNGITPPPVVPFRIELKLSPTHYRLGVMSTATSGDWSASGNKIVLTQTCPNAKTSDPPYTATGDTIVLYGSKQDYTSGGCRWIMQYALMRQ